MNTPENIRKEIQSMNLTEVTILARNLALFIRGLLEENHVSINDISDEFKEWVNSLNSYEVLLVQTGVLYRAEQLIAAQENVVNG